MDILCLDDGRRVDISILSTVLIRIRITGLDCGFEVEHSRGIGDMVQGT
jgi:hypothetical protein